MSTRITRREFLKGTALGVSGLALGGRVFADVQLPKTKPNLLFIHTDQQHFEAISGLGNKYLKTPNMDRLMKRGMTFTQSYSADPVCCPARACWFTGRAASENGVMTNGLPLDPNMPDLGQWLKTRGYSTFYTGKWHIPRRDNASGFTVLTSNPSHLGQHTDGVVSRSAQAFFSNYSGDKPFFFSIGLLQPHDCCYWITSHDHQKGDCPYPSIKDELPPLPPNFHYNVKEPKVLAEHLAKLRSKREWTDEFWRYYIWSYYRMVEMADAQLGRILDALEDSKFANDTLIVFTVDHGDGTAHRKLVTKFFTYDEAIRVPMIVCLPGSSGGGRLDKEHVVSGLDVAPTLCDFAGVEAPPDIRGRSLRPLAEGKSKEWREFVVSECLISGRMLRTPEYKLVAFKDDPVLQLFDMRNDPWEMTNLAEEARHAGTVADLRKRLAEWEGRLKVNS